MRKMPSLSASELLDIWDRGRLENWIERALTMLEIATKEPRAALAELPIAARDSQLHALRAALFGSVVRGVASCPKCQERLESSFDITALEAHAAKESCELAHDDEVLELRLPTSADLLAVRGAEDARSQLVARCVRARSGLALDRVPAAILERAVEQLAKLDPLGDLSLDLACPACGSTFLLPFDVASFLWREIEATALRLLREVHILASAYGWREAEILSLAPARRQAYLEMVGA